MITGSRMKYWEIIADNLSKAGWSLGWVSAIDSEGRTSWIADAHQGDEKRCLKKSASEMLIRSRSALLVMKGYLPREAAHGLIS